MRIGLERAERRWPRVPLLPLAAVVLWGAMVASIAFVFPHPVSPMRCVLKAATGVPCPTCGGTRAVKSLVAGDVLGAVAWNPMVMASLAGAGAVLIARVGFRRRVRLEASRSERRVLLLAGLAVVGVNWVYVLATQGVGAG